MAHGGKRAGAGRKKNSANRASQRRQAEVAASGATPLDVMLADMRHHHAIAEAEAAKGDEADAATVAKHRAAARDAAKDAAPYVHPRLAAVEHMGKGGGPIEFTDARERLARLVAGHSGAGSADAGSGKPQ